MKTILYDNSNLGNGYAVGIEVDTPKGNNETHLLYYSRITKEEFVRMLELCTEEKESYVIDLVSEEKGTKTYSIYPKYVKIRD